MCVCVYIYIYISKGLRPTRHRARRPPARGPAGSWRAGRKPECGTFRAVLGVPVVRSQGSRGLRGLVK